MNIQTFEHLWQTNKKNIAKRGEEINHLQNNDFVKWLKDNNLINWIK